MSGHEQGVGSGLVPRPQLRLTAKDEWVVTRGGDEHGVDAPGSAKQRASDTAGIPSCLAKRVVNRSGIEKRGLPSRY